MIKQKGALLVLLAFAILLTSFVAVSATTPTTLFSDNFNDNNLYNGGWTSVYFQTSDTANQDVGTSDNYTYDGSYYAWMRDDAGIYKTINTTGYENITFSYCKRTLFANGSDYLRTGWKEGSFSSDLSEWNQIEQVQTDNWSCTDFDLDSSANDGSITIAFFLDDGDGNYGKVDNVEVTGMTMGDTTPPVCSVDYLGSYPLSSGTVNYINSEGYYRTYGTAMDNDSGFVPSTSPVSVNRTSPDYTWTWVPADDVSPNPDWNNVDWYNDFPTSGGRNDYYINGKHQICCKAVDSAGNIFTGGCQEICIDETVPPQVLNVIQDNPSECVPNYVNENPSWTWDAVEDDGCAGIDYYEVELYFSNGTLITTVNVDENSFYVEDPINGQDYYIRVRAVDNAGNEGPWSADSIHVYYDSEAPEVHLEGELLPTQGTWFNDDFQVEESDTDNLGIVSCEYMIKNNGDVVVNWTNTTCNANISVQVPEICDEETCTVYKRATDYACNVGDDSEWYKIDLTPPNTTKTVGKPRVSGWLFNWIGFDWDLDWFIRDDTSISFTCDDFSMSGCDETYYRYNYNNGTWTEWMTYEGSFYFEDGDGIYELEYYSVDNVGNVEEIQYEIDKVDTQAPTTIKTIGEPKYYNEENEKLYVTSDTEFTFTCNDTEVGCDGTWYSINENDEDYYCDWTQEEPTCGFNLEGEDGLYTVNYNSWDLLGNEEESNYEEDWLDNTPPYINIINPKEEQQENKCSLSFAAQVWDLSSGVNDSTIKVELVNSTESVVKESYNLRSGVLDLAGIPEGNYTLRVIATDNVGNTNTSEKHITLLSGVFVEQVVGDCSIEAGQEGDCTFTFQVCARDSSAVSLWTSKLYSIQDGQKVLEDVIDPFTLNSSITNEHELSTVGLKEDGVRYDSLDDPNYEITPLKLSENKCDKINGRVYGAFDLNMDFSANDTEIIGSNDYYFDYDLQAYNYDDECQQVED